jgi:nucleotide-binding universal stress UspA family protein
MFNRILVPLDGSTLAERAIPHAEEIARIFKSDIFLLQVLDPTSFHENPNPVDPISWQIRKAEADMYMRGIATRMRQNLNLEVHNDQDKENIGEDTGQIQVGYAIREGKTAENIVNFAHTENIDLLVMSSHGSGGLSRWNISSVTQKVINLIYLPILIVRAYLLPQGENAKVHYRRILLPIDSSRRAECALSAGIELARGEGSRRLDSFGEGETFISAVSEVITSTSRLTLLAVIKSPELPIPEPYPVEIEQLTEQFLHVSQQAASMYLNEMKERLPVECEVLIVENNSVSTAIHELASSEEDIDLVVLCAHGYTGQVTWPYGSVARNYIEHGTKPVLVIQDVPRSRFMPTTAELAAEKSGGR